MKTEYIGRALLIAAGITPFLIVLKTSYSYWGHFGQLSPGSGYALLFTSPIYIALFVVGLVLYIKGLRSGSAHGRNLFRRSVEEAVTWVPVLPLILFTLLILIGIFMPFSLLMFATPA
ncbi:MAG TPA: hypothetical protein VGE23_01270 [Candidatus Paceibacterota bacterium]